MHSTRRLIHLAAAICVMGMSLIAVPVTHAAEPVTITVNSNAYDMAVNGNCNLMEALAAATNNAAQDTCTAGGAALPDVIAFNIGGGGAQTISPTIAVTVDSPVYINGSSQPGYAGTPLIRISRSVTPVLRLNDAAIGSTVRSLQIDTSGGAGDVVEIYADNITMIGNYICTEGSSVIGSCWEAVMLSESSNSDIGGGAASDRNLIGGERGVTIWGGHGNEITGNYFGVTAAGNALLAGTPLYPMHGVNMGHAVETYGNTVRGNVISGDYDRGVYIEAHAHDNVVVGNIIGLGADGVTRIGNSTGLKIEGGADNIVGGPTAADRNVISGNGYNLRVDDYTGGVPVTASGNNIQGNYIGTTADGMSRVTAWGSEDADEIGIYVQGGDTTTIGGPTAAHGNVVAANDDGIYILDAATSTQILNNKIGTNATGTAVLQQQFGVYLHGGAVAMIGDSVTPGNNLISGNGTGILLGGGAGSATIYNNRIGLKALGNAPLPNTDGIIVAGAATATIAENWIAHNSRWGLNTSDTATITAGSIDNCITGNGQYGAYAGFPGTPTFTVNWWGVPTGPTHLTNPGGTGDAVTDGVVYSPFLTTPPAACPRAESDFDGDGLTDIAKYTPATHMLEYRRSSTETWASQEMGSEDLSYVVRSDFDGDGMADPAKFIASNGSLLYLGSQDGTWYGEYLGPGTYDYLPASDFDGDGYDDPATYAAGSNVLWYLESSTASWHGEYLGPGAYTIVPGSDFDGDGKTDPAHFNSSINALWYRGSSDATWHGVYLGPGTYSFVPGSDFDGDAITDAAHFNSTSNALWYRKSSTSTWHSLYMGAGTLTFIPAGDYDGDGLTDPAHFDTGSNVAWGYFGGTWHGMWLGPGTYQIVN